MAEIAPHSMRLGRSERRPAAVNRAYYDAEPGRTAIPRAEAYRILQAAMAENAERTSHCARRVFAILAEMGIQPRSIVDFGCGAGSWLAEARRVAGAEVLGVDGRWTDPSTLEIAPTEFRAVDLMQRVDLGRQFDLALSVEVAEHLPASAAEGLIASITTHTDIVVFSAAIPGQGGMGHVNEQWPDYWGRHFAFHGFRCLDVFREALWADQSIDWWYKQNLLLFRRDQGPTVGKMPRRLVHPDLYTARCVAPPGDIVYENGASNSRFWTIDQS